MARKHENFNWSGYKYAPESVGFSLNGKRLNLPEELRNRIAYLAVCGRNKEVLDELKRALRKDEKQPLVVGKCVCFFKKDSNEFYYTQQIRYNPNDLQDALRCYKEWKHYIESKDCILETGYELTEGKFEPFGNSKVTTTTVTSVVDLSRCRTIKVVRESILA